MLKFKNNFGKVMSLMLIALTFFALMIFQNKTYIAQGVSATDGTVNYIYVGNNETGTEDGTEQSPYNSISSAISKANAGDVIRLLNSITSIPQVYKTLTFEGVSNEIKITSTSENYLGGGSAGSSSEEITVTYRNLICNNGRAITSWDSSNQVNVNYVFDNVSFTTSNDVPNIFATVGSVKSIKIINSDFSNINNTAVWFMYSVGAITIENSQITNADGFLKLRYGDNCTVNLKNNTIVDSGSVVVVEGKATTTTEIVLENNTIKNCEQVLYIKADEDNVVDTNDCVIRFTLTQLNLVQQLLK